MITAPFSYGYAAHYSYSQTVVTCRWIIMPRLSIRTSCEYVLYMKLVLLMIHTIQMINTARF